MRIIGLTGPTGSGKSTVAGILESKGFTVIDCDKTAREVVGVGSPLLDILAQAFGEDVILPDGSLDRKLLAKKAFCSDEQTEKLNSIMLPFIADRIKEMLDLYMADGIDAVVLDAPTLFESGLDSVCDSVIAVLCSRETRKQRIITRDKLTEEQAEVRLKASRSDEFYTERTPHIVSGDGTVSEVETAVTKIIGEVL